MTAKSAKPAAQRRSSRPNDAKMAQRSTRTSVAKQTVNAAPSPKAQAILAAAEPLFARFGFEGVALESIAAEAGISRHNLLYYFPSKDALYRQVLDGVMDRWLESMRAMSVSSDPQEALSAYIAAKLKFSREHPAGSQVFTREVAAGAPRYADVIEQRVAPMLREDLKTLDKWAREGRIERIDFTHLMFLIWSVTQAYADLAPQFALLLGKAKLEDKDFAAAEKVVTRLVIEGLSKRD